MSGLMLQSTKIPAGTRLDLRELLLLGGAGQFMAELSIAFMNMLPGTCDPSAQGVIQILQCLQRLLNDQAGARLEVSGRLDHPTQDAIRIFSGPSWYEKSWAQIYNDVIAGKRWKGYRRDSRDPMTRGGRPDPLDTNIAAETAINEYMQGMGAFEDLGTTEGVLWQMRSGVAIPLSYVMLGYFQAIQRAVNAINAHDGKPLVTVDGRIGPATADAVGLIANKYGSDPWANVNITATYVAENAAASVSELVSLMGRIGATYVPDPKVSAAKVSVVKPDGTIYNPPDGPSTTTLVLGAVAVGAVIAFMSKKKRRK